MLREKAKDYVGNQKSSAQKKLSSQKRVSPQKFGCTKKLSAKKVTEPEDIQMNEMLLCKQCTDERPPLQMLRWEKVVHYERPPTLRGLPPPLGGGASCIRALFCPENCNISHLSQI